MIATLTGWLLHVPIWIIGVALFGGMVASAWLGSWLRKHHDQSANERGVEKEGLVVSSVMGLLALLIGFTFSLALDRFDTRRAAVLEEANAIGTAYLQTQLLDSPHRERISELLIGYANNRLVLAQAQPGSKELQAALTRDDEQISRLWQAVVAAFPSVKGYDFSSTYVSSMNLMIDMDETRKAARRASVPGEVFLLLFVYQFVSSGVVGYALVGGRARQGAAFLFFLFGLSLVVVLDLNRATTGWIKVSQQPIIDLIEMIRENPPSKFAPAPSPAA